MGRGELLKRHGSGPVSQVGGYVAACHALDVEDLAAEYRERVESTPTRTRTLPENSDSAWCPAR